MLKYSKLDKKYLVIAELSNEWGNLTGFDLFAIFSIYSGKNYSLRYLLLPYANIQSPFAV